MRKRLFDIIEVAKDDDKISQIYDVLMLISIIASIVPLAFKNSNTIFELIDIVTVCIFIFDYLFRLITADYKLEKNYVSFVKYPFTPMAIIDLLSILPSITLLNNGFKLFKIFRLLRTLRVIRVFKSFRYSKNIQIIVNVLKRQKDSLSAVCILAIGYIVVTALVMFNVEPDTFETFYDAIYWSTVSLTTMGYGDIYATSDFGQLVTMISALFGIAIVALPAGIITAGYMEEIENKSDDV